MVAISPAVLARRDDEYYYCDWWSCNTSAFIVKWVIVGVIVLIFLLWFVGGYFHAQARMKKGHPPLAYHRFLVSRRQRSQFMPQPPPPNEFSYYNPQTGRYTAPQYGQAFPMQPWAPPPPAYQAQGFVPPYPGAPGASKIDPDQSFTPPQGPPPNAGQSSTNVRELEEQNNSVETDHLNPTAAAGPSLAHNAEPVTIR